MSELKKHFTVLHTSDWHLGRSLYGRKRYAEQEAFLNWLGDCLESHEVDILLVAGDVFDNGTPSIRAQELYYRFLHRVAGSCCGHVVIVAGNHDSPSFLSVPSELLRGLGIHVVGAAGEDVRSEVLSLGAEPGKTELLVCAVPYLRERDIRSSLFGESLEDKDRQSREGIRRHYEEAVATASRIRAEAGGDIPILVMGHLFTAGGHTVEGDGVRDLYVGSLAQVPSSIFPAEAAYVALGHLHVPQQVKGACEIRYSGSPIPMGFGEAGQEKSVCLVTLQGSSSTVNLLPVPLFQRLERIKGDRESIVSRLEQLLEEKASAWLEILLDSGQPVGDLRDSLEEMLAGSALEVLKISSSRPDGQTLEGAGKEEHLADLDPVEVFDRCLALHMVPEEMQSDLREMYQEVLRSLHDEGVLGEVISPGELSR